MFTFLYTNTMQIGINSEWKQQAALEIVIKHWSASKISRMARVPMLLNYISSAEHISGVELDLKMINML